MSEALETKLSQLREHLSYPPTPPLAASVSAALRSAQPVRLSHRVAWLRIGYAAVAIALLVTLIGLLVPDTRNAVADRLGLRGLRIISVPDPEAGVRRADPRMVLGVPAPLEAVADQLGFPVLVPESIGPPDEVYMNRSVPGGEVTLVYGGRPDLPETAAGIGLLLSQTPGHSIQEVYEKAVGPGGSVRLTRVGDQPALWISGPPHRIAYVSPSGGGQMMEARLAANVLVFERNGFIVRIEGAMEANTAIRIAASLR
jgi:hypothetical protein